MTKHQKLSFALQKTYNEPIKEIFEKALKKHKVNIKNRTIKSEDIQAIDAELMKAFVELSNNVVITRSTQK